MSHANDYVLIYIKDWDQVAMEFWMPLPEVPNG